MAMTITERKELGDRTAVDVVVGNTTTRLVFSDIGLPLEARVISTGLIRLSLHRLGFFWRTNDKGEMLIFLTETKTRNHIGLLNDEDGKLKEMLDRVGWRFA